MKVLISGVFVHPALCLCLRWWWSLNFCLSSDNSKLPCRSEWLAWGCPIWSLCYGVNILDFYLFAYFLAVLDSAFQSYVSQKPDNLKFSKLWQIPDWLQSDGKLLAEKLLCTLEPSLKSTVLHRGWECHGLLASPDHVSQSYAWEIWRNLIPDLHVAACAINPFIF